MPCIHDSMFDWSVDKASSPGSFPWMQHFGMHNIVLCKSEKYMMNSVGMGGEAIAIPIPISKSSPY